MALFENPNNRKGMHIILRKTIGFFKTSLIGGFLVILPLALLFIVFKALFLFITKRIEPLSNLVIQNMRNNIEEYEHIVVFLADFISIALILFICFVVGAVVRTRSGRFFVAIVEKNLFDWIPGYKIIRETISQFFGKGKLPFSRVALVNAFGNETLLTAFITDEHADGIYTVFIPTGPNPTSGNIMHLKKEHVHEVTISTEIAMKSIIACGAASKPILEQYRKQQEIKKNS
jgi:uncharacterized membrane protein